jgi:hypothetical protein
MKNNSIDITSLDNTHVVWNRFSNWLIKTFGSDLHGDWFVIEFNDCNGKKQKFRYRHFDDLELSRRLVGFEVLSKIERYVKRYCPEIRVVRCDDSNYSGSSIIVIPHPKHGITMMFIPQTTTIQNQFFLYENHHKQLVTVLKEMGEVYSSINQK